MRWSARCAEMYALPQGGHAVPMIEHLQLWRHEPRVAGQALRFMIRAATGDSPKWRATASFRVVLFDRELSLD